MKNALWFTSPLKFFIMLLVLALPFAACDDDDDLDQPRTFTVTIQNVSTSTTLQVGALPDRTAPISPGVWAIYDSGSLFQLDQEADLGTERLAEEGSTTEKTAMLNAATWVDDNGEFSSPAGANGPVIGSGESATFTFEATQGQKLQIMTMFGNSNDWFYAFDDGGLDLYNGDNAVSGDVTSQINLYDAGTEQDEMPGLGTFQKPDHPTTIDIGPVDAVDMITIAQNRHTGFTIPANGNVIRVTISSTE